MFSIQHAYLAINIIALSLRMCHDVRCKFRLNEICFRSFWFLFLLINLISKNSSFFVWFYSFYVKYFKHFTASLMFSSRCCFLLCCSCYWTSQCFGLVYPCVYVCVYVCFLVFSPTFSFVFFVFSWLICCLKSPIVWTIYALCSASFLFFF